MVVRCRIVVVAKQTSRRREDGVVMVSATEKMMERKWRCCVAVFWFAEVWRAEVWQFPWLMRE